MKSNLEMLEFIEDRLNDLSASISIAESYGQTGTCDHCWLKGEVQALEYLRDYMFEGVEVDAEI